MSGNTRSNARVDYAATPNSAGSGQSRIKDAETPTPGTRSSSSPQRVGRVQLDAVRPALTNRDFEVLQALAAFRLATTDQLRRGYFAGYRSESAAAWMCRAMLRKLVGFGLVDHLAHRVGGVRAGSAGKVWRLRPAGWRMLAITTANGRTPRIVRSEPSVHVRDHTLAITETAVQLRETERAGAVELIECTPEPASWRTYLNAGGGLVTLKPDLFAVTAAKNAAFEDVWFIEVDRATESLPTIRRKAAQYDRYRNTGREQAAQGVFPKVVWLTPDTTRAEQITAALAGANGGSHASHEAMPLDQFANRVSTTDLSQPGSDGHLPSVTEGEHP